MPRSSKNALTQMHQADAGAMVQSLAISVCDAQYDMDRKAILHFRNMVQAFNAVRSPDYDADSLDPEVAAFVVDDPNGSPRSILELGLKPKFFSMNAMQLEIQVAFSMSQSHEFGLGIKLSIPKLFAATIDANYKQRYSFDSSASSTITTSIVPVPAPEPIQGLLAEVDRYVAEEGQAQA